MHTLSILLRFFALVLCIFPFISAFAQQTQSEHTGWFAWSNTYKFASRWGILTDFQVRSGDKFDYARMLLLRPGLTYYFNSNNNATVGYAFVQTYADNGIPGGRDLAEHRIWEQYILTHKIKGLPLTHRFRTEQRFMERADGSNLFAQRLRYFARLIVPLKAPRESFNKGPFAALQNEVLFNIQNKEQLNNHLFDQNRAYIAVGYRLSPKVDIEAGYLNQYIKGLNNNTRNNVAQLMLYTRF